jgi:uncharacterized protein YecE (DUF72 family)
MPDLRIGISGWNYPPWRGTFYPPELAQKRELEHASRRVNSIEINGSFYSLQRPSSYQKWYDSTPEGFVFSVKAPRYISHLKRLSGVETPLANFFASGVLRLKEKLGPILWQLPPMLPFDRGKLEAFFNLLPRDTAAAAALARRHDDKVAGRSWTKTDLARPLRYALEVRHPTFQTPEFIALLREHRIAVVVADTAGRWPFMEDLTADLVYVRLHGAEQLYVSGYTDEALTEWARKIRGWSRGQNPTQVKTHARPMPPRKGGRDVYVYFDNDVKVRAPYDAMSLAHKLGLGPKPEAGPDPATIPELPRPIRSGGGGNQRWQFAPRAKKPASRPARRPRLVSK